MPALRHLLHLAVLCSLLLFPSPSVASTIEYIVSGDVGGNTSFGPRLGSVLPSGPASFIFIYNGAALQATSFTIGQHTLTWNTGRDGQGGIGLGLGFVLPTRAQIGTCCLGEDASGLFSNPADFFNGPNSFFLEQDIFLVGDFTESFAAGVLQTREILGSQIEVNFIVVPFGGPFSISDGSAGCPSPLGLGSCQYSGLFIGRSIFVPVLSTLLLLGIGFASLGASRVIRRGH